MFIDLDWFTLILLFYYMTFLFINKKCFYHHYDLLYLSFYKHVKHKY